MSRRALYLGQTLIHAHSPEGGGDRPAVLIVPPFGWDDVSSHRARREWADRLAAAGSPAVRLDLPGTGDSGGGPGDPGLVAAWTDAVGDTAAWLRGAHGDRRVVAIGLGSGGLIAWAAAARGAAIDDLVLWGVPARGRGLVRELRAFAALKQDEWGDGDPPPEARPIDGFDVTGYVLATETAEALSALDLTALALPDPAARRILLLGRDGLPVDARLQDRAAAGGSAVQAGDGPGWGAMVSGPQEAVAPEATFARVDEWLRGAEAAPLAPAPAAPAESDSLELLGATERPWTARRDFGSQFGILTVPAGTGPAPLGLILLNGGAVRHTGPNRMWVELARRWAARGVPVLRMDVEGLGDSDGDGRPYVDSARLYEPRLSAQPLQAVAELSADGVAGRWLVAGLCAGASWAFHAALHGDERVSAAVMVNPFAFYWEDELVVERDLSAARRLRSVAGWKRLLAGGVTAARVRAAAAHAVRTPLERGRRRERTQTRVERERADITELAGRGTRLTLLVGRDEPVYDRLERDGLLADLERHGVTLRRLPTRDHTFRAPWLQDLVHAELDTAVAAELERHGVAAR